MIKKNIVGFSGGKDSTAMLLLMIENNWWIDEVIFFDTGWEFPEMYKHIENVEKYTGYKITTLHPDKSFDYWMFDHVKTKGKFKGTKGYSWASFYERWCTRIKIDTVRKYLNKKYGSNFIEHIGIAIDENRKLKENTKYPLIEYGFTEKDALNYCYSHGFDWNGLYKLFRRVSCYNCPLQSLNELKQLYTHRNKLWQRIKEYDKRTWRSFRYDYSLQELEKKFENENKQLKILFYE